MPPVKWSNAVRFKGKLSRLPKAVGDAAASAMEQEARDITDAMKRLVPVNTGALRDTIGWTRGGSMPLGSNILISTAGKRRGRRSGSRRAGPNTGASGPLRDSLVVLFAGSFSAYWARFVEFGTRLTRAQPFFWPTWRSFKKGSRSRISRKVNAVIKKIARS